MDLSSLNFQPMQPARSGATLAQELPGIADIVWAISARLGGRRDPVRLALASAEPRTGNTVLSAATAIALARHLRVPVVLVETDVERPALAGYLGLEPRGLSDVLDGRAELADCVQSPPEFPELSVLTAGTARRAVAGELTTESFRALLEELGTLGRYVVLDLPPLVGQLGARQLAQQVDGAILVARAHSTSLVAAERAHAILLDARVQVLGALFNAYGTPGDFRPSQPPDGSLVARSRLRPHAPAAEPEAPSRILPVELVHDDASAAHAPEVANGTNGGPAPAFAEPRSDEEHRQEVELLQRRIAKLTLQLERTEAELRRIAKAKNIELGLSSIYRTVQGLSLEDEAVAMKKELMQKIFHANLALKQALQRRP